MSTEIADKTTDVILDEIPEGFSERILGRTPEEKFAI